MDRPEPETRFQETLNRSNRLRIGAAVGAVLVGVFGVAVAFAASPTPTAAPGATAPSDQKAPSATGAPFFGRGFGVMRGFGGFGGGFDGLSGGSVAGPITIGAISGSSVTLQTADGWTRTITVDSSTQITRAGIAAKLGDLKAGDEVRFRQTRANDGTYTVSAIDIVLPTVLGEVTAKDAGTLTVKRYDGTSMTIHVGSSTTFNVPGATTAGLADITVGMRIAAQGTQRADGSLDAVAINAGRGMTPGKGPGFTWPFGPKPSASPGATTAPG
jgi:Domain of unknown function (DUF5666)